MNPRDLHLLTTGCVGRNSVLFLYCPGSFTRTLSLEQNLLVSQIFWLHFCTVRGSGDALSISFTIDDVHSLGGKGLHYSYLLMCSMLIYLPAGLKKV